MGNEAECPISATGRREPGRASPFAEQGQVASAARTPCRASQAALIEAPHQRIGMVPLLSTTTMPCLDWRRALPDCS